MAYDERALRGIGGWLAFLIVLLGIVGPLWLLMLLLGTWQMAADEIGMDRTVFQWTMAVTTISRIAVMLYIAWLLYTVHRPATVRIAILGLWVASIGVTILHLMLLVVFTNERPLVTIIGGIPLLALEALPAAIWTLYLRCSRRVANTYALDGNVADVFH